MTAAEVLDSIKDHKQRGGSWFQMASMIDEVSRSAGWVGYYKSNAEWLKAAAVQSGYQATVVRRMLRVRKFLERMTKQAGFAVPQESTLPLASLEVLERMFPIAPERCRELLNKAVKGEITLREVQREYSAVTKLPLEDSDSAMRAPFHKQLADAVSESIELFSGKRNMHILFQPKRPGYFMIDAIATTTSKEKNSLCVGFEFKFVSNNNTMRKNLNNVLHEIAFVSQFFDRFWLIFSDGAGTEYAKWMTVTMRDLGLVNVGVAVLKDRPDQEGSYWQFFGSVLNPAIQSPESSLFFPTPDQYAPRWKHLLLRHLYPENAL